MATKKKSKPAAKKKPAKTAAKKSAAPKNKPKPTRAAAAKPAAEEREETGEDDGEAAATGAAPKLKPLTMKQRLALIPRDPVTGKCPHGLMPETCSFCMGI